MSKIRVGRGGSWGWTRSLALALAISLCVATAGLVWLAYRATREWQRSTALLVEHRQEVMLALLSTALRQDMKAAQVSVLLPIRQESLVEDPPYDLESRFARAFARFPYPESFFVWTKSGQADGQVYFFNRADRPPPWRAADREAGSYPVVMLRDPAGVEKLVEAARREAASGRSLAVFECDVAGAPYQVVVQLLPRRDRTGPWGLAGFTVNLHWVREHYFGELAREVARIGGDEGSLSLAILDDARATVAATAPVTPGAPARERQFSLLFFDPAMTSMLSSGGPPVRRWTVRVGATDRSPLAAASLGARRTFVLLALAALATVIGLLLTARSVQVRAELAAMKSEFVATVTHELKSPLALIRLVGETIALGRYKSIETVRDYSRLLSHEALRLTRLIDNLLLYARLGEGRSSYAFEAVDLTDLVEDGLDHFRPRLCELGFDVKVELPPEPAKVRADRTALLQVLDNLLDNAIKYAGEGRSVAIRGRIEGRAARLEVADKGAGIPEHELPRVFDKFYRGRGARGEGSGLGLAIVRRIVADHGGRVEIESAAGQGTTVGLVLPVAGR